LFLPQLLLFALSRFGFTNTFSFFSELFLMGGFAEPSTPALNFAKPVYFLCSLACIEHNFFFYPAQLIRVEHNSLFAVWFVSSTALFFVSSNLIRIEHNSLFAVWPVSSTAFFFVSSTTFQNRTQLFICSLACIEHNSLF